MAGVSVMKPLYGKLPEYFDSELEPFINYVERLQAYFRVNNIEDGRNQRAILITVLGPKAYSVLRNVAKPHIVTDLSFVQIVDILRNHYNPKPSHKDLAKRLFTRRIRAPEESVADYIVALLGLTENWDCENLDKDIIDQLMLGIDDEVMYNTLADLPIDATLDDAVKSLQTIEILRKVSPEPLTKSRASSFRESKLFKTMGRTSKK